MEILQTIHAHASAMRLPLYAVTLSAVPKAATPVMLILHWHGFRRQSTVSLEGVTFPPRPVAGSALQINTPWHQIENLDEAMLEAAWKLGAWDLERVTYRPWWRLNAPLEETLACYRAFANYPEDDAERHVMVQAPDQAELLEMASMRGYVRWMFRPRTHGIWKEVSDDDVTLEEGERRSTPCPVKAAAFDRHRPGRRLYRLGRAGSIFVGRTRKPSGSGQ